MSTLLTIVIRLNLLQKTFSFSAKILKTIRFSNKLKNVIIMDVKPDLSKFRLHPKRKLSTKNTGRLEPESSEIKNEEKHIKRKHIKIEYDNSKSDMKNVKTWAPNSWEQVLSNIREMRKNFDAPVDSMGCDKCQEASASPEVL